jgi:acyl-CoA thioesterase I
MLRRYCLLLTGWLGLSTMIYAEDSDRIKVACVGDSITAGHGTDGKTYPLALQALLGEKYQVKNFGNSGSTLLRKGDKPYIQQQEYRDAIAFAASIVIIKLGTNDTKPQNFKMKESIIPDALALVEDFRKANPKATIYLVLPVPAFPENFGITDNVIKNDLIPLLKQAAEKAKVKTIDAYTPLINQAELFPDKVHPSGLGAAALAKVIHAGLNLEGSK